VSVPSDTVVSPSESEPTNLSNLTEPPISVAQNTSGSQRLLAAQAVLYGRAKAARNLRISVTVLASVALGIAAALSDDADVPVGVVGGVLVLLVSQYVAYRQGATTALAVSIQEKFDTDVYQLAWNSAAVRSVPTNQVVAARAAQYSGDRTENWYPDTKTVERPLDIVICQQSNLGWGAATHSKWGAVVTGASLVLIVALALLWWIFDLSAGSGLNILVLPALPVLIEAIDELRRHFESARLKDEMQQKVLEVWREGLTAEGVPVLRCREIQNEIVHIRQSNAQVPDWFDRRLRGKSESAMRIGAEDMMEEAKRQGRA
jgi:hypothetical protein